MAMATLSLPELPDEGAGNEITGKAVRTLSANRSNIPTRVTQHCPPSIRQTVTPLAVLMRNTACKSFLRKSFDDPVIQCKRHGLTLWRFRTDQRDEAAHQVLPLPLSLGDPVVVAAPNAMKISRQQRLCNTSISRENAAE